MPTSFVREKRIKPQHMLEVFRILKLDPKSSV